MAKFHINSKGEVGQCSAKPGGCPFGGESEHFDNKEAAVKAAEERLKKEHGTVPNAKTKTSKSKVSSDSERLADAERLLNYSKQEIVDYQDELEAMRFEEGEVDYTRKEFIEDELKLLEKNVKLGEKAVADAKMKIDAQKTPASPVRTRESLEEIERDAVQELERLNAILDQTPSYDREDINFTKAEIREVTRDLRWSRKELTKMDTAEIEKDYASVNKGDWLMSGNTRHFTDDERNVVRKDLTKIHEKFKNQDLGPNGHDAMDTLIDSIAPYSEDRSGNPNDALAGAMKSLRLIGDSNKEATASLRGAIKRIIKMTGKKSTE